MSGLNILWHLHTLRKNQWLDTRRIQDIQEKKLRAIIRYAYENVEFYHRRFDDLKLKPSAIRTTNDLKKIPVTTRMDLQTGFPATMVARGVPVDKCTKHVSSGSTGVPATVVGDRRTEDYRAALFGRPFFEGGLRWRDKMLRISMIRDNTRLHPTWYERLGFMRRRIVSPMDPVEAAMKSLSSYRPDALFGHTSFIRLMAEKLAENPRSEWKPRLVFTTAEIMTRKTRQAINSAFNIEAFDLYGCVEVERVAWECDEHAGYHMDIDSQVIEFIDGEEHVAPNEQGRILLTCLYNYAMPLIRYDVGDAGVPSDDKCPCGRGLPLMKNIEGRVNDFVHLPSGRMVSPTAYLFVDEIPGIVKFRIIQERRDKIRVEVVLERGCSPHIAQEIRDHVRLVSAEEIDIEVVPLAEIPAEKSGKIRIVKSLV